MMRRIVLVGVLAGSLLAWADAPAQWPQFHGPGRDNISKETGLLSEWPAGGPKLAWKINGIGDGYSSVSIAAGKIFTAGDIGGESFVIALNLADGQQAWKSPLGKSGGGGGYAGPRATPTVDGDRLYTIGQYGDIVANSVADGKEIWRTNLNKDHGGKMMSGWGNSESLLIDGNNLICTPGGKGGTLMALDKMTGKPVWRSKDFADNAAYASPFVTEIGGVRQVPVLTDKSVAGINVADGSLLWRVDRPGATAVIPVPVVHENYVYVTSGYGVGCDLFKINAAGGKFTVEPVYTKNKTMVNHHGGVIYLDGALYGYSDGKGWTCQDFLSGEAKWKEKDALGKGTISYADGRFYLRDEKKGTIVLIEASKEAYKERGRFEQPDRSGKNAWPHLVIAGGRLYVRDQGTLLCYEVKK